MQSNIFWGSRLEQFNRSRSRPFILLSWSRPTVVATSTVLSWSWLGLESFMTHSTKWTGLSFVDLSNASSFRHHEWRMHACQIRNLKDLSDISHFLLPCFFFIGIDTTRTPWWSPNCGLASLSFLYSSAMETLILWHPTIITIKRWWFNHRQQHRTTHHWITKTEDNFWPIWWEWHLLLCWSHHLRLPLMDPVVRLILDDLQPPRRNWNGRTKNGLWPMSETLMHSETQSAKAKRKAVPGSTFSFNSNVENLMQWAEPMVHWWIWEEFGELCKSYGQPWWLSKHSLLLCECFSFFLQNAAHSNLPTVIW